MNFYDGKKLARGGRLFMSALLACVFYSVAVPHVSAANDKPELHLTSRPVSGSTLQNSQVIAQGRVSYSDAHDGFQVWLDADRNGHLSNQYILIGKNDSDHQLRVRIEQDGCITDIKEGKGIIKLTGEDQADFSIVVDGDQNVTPDEYAIVAHAGVIVP